MEWTHQCIMMLSGSATCIRCSQCKLIIKDATADGWFNSERMNLDEMKLLCVI